MASCNNNNFGQLTHTFNRVIEEFKEHIIRIELAFAELGECEVYHYVKNGESIVVVFTADDRIVVNVKLNDSNIAQAGYIFNTKEFSKSPEKENPYQTTFFRVMEGDEELKDMMKRFFEI